MSNAMYESNKNWNEEEMNPEHFDGWENEVDKGWGPLVRLACDYLRNNYPKCRILQVKEKFGGLRFYFSAEAYPEETSKEIYEYIGSLENKSFQTCERCGAPGSPQNVTRYWVKTVCADCAELEVSSRDW